MGNFYGTPKWDKETTKRMEQFNIDFTKKLRDDINVLVKALPQWDGKVLNARFTNAINPKMKHFTFHLGETRTGYGTITHENGRKEPISFPMIPLKYYYIGGNYRHNLPVELQFSRPIELMIEDNCRLKASESIARIKEDIFDGMGRMKKEFADAVKNYDKYEKQIAKLYQEIKKYNETRNKWLCPYVWAEESY